MKFKRLKAEMVLKNISNEDLAQALGVHKQSIYAKLVGKQTITLAEAFKIQKRVNPEISIEELFAEF